MYYVLFKLKCFFKHLYNYSVEGWERVGTEFKKYDVSECEK